MAKNAKGEIFVGSSPDGKVYKLGANGKFDVWFDPKAKYIWALLFGKDGALYAATGTEGKIYKITAQGKGSVFCDTDEVHIRSLAWDNEGNLLAGSSGNGYLYRIALDGTKVVLASTGREEVNQIAVGADGVVWFAATGASVEKEGKKDKEGTNPPSARKAASADSGEKTAPSQLWRLDRSLYARPIWSTPETILTLDREGEDIQVGTASDGYLYRVDERGRATRLLKLEGPSVTATAGAFLASSGPASVYRLGAEGKRKEPGVYESEVVDSGHFAKWGAVHAEGKGRFEIETRSGNTPKPDGSWYPWVSLRESRSQSPAARYVQYRLEIAEGTVDHVDLSYLPKNLPPKIGEISILDPGIGYMTLPAAPEQSAPQTADQLLQAGTSGSSSHPVRYQTILQHGYRTVVWKASDPNGDGLQYTVSYRAKDDASWRVLVRDQTERVFSWDTSGWPDGTYFLKVAASDAADNPSGEALTDEEISRSFRIDNTPPAIRVESGKSRHVAFTVKEEEGGSGISSVSVSKDGNEFKALLPADGVVDPRAQKFVYKLDPDEVLFIRAEDQAGNVASAPVKP